MHLNIFGITSKRNILCIYPKEGQEKENKEDEEMKRTKKKRRCRKSMKIILGKGTYQAKASVMNMNMVLEQI